MLPYFELTSVDVKRTTAHPAQEHVAVTDLRAHQRRNTSAGSRRSSHPTGRTSPGRVRSRAHDGIDASRGGDDSRGDVSVGL